MMSNAPSNSNGRALWAQFAGILLAATVLGVIYNSSSPLRVAEVVPSDSPAVPAGVIPPKSATVRTGVHNETISMTLELPAAVAPPATTPAGVAPKTPAPAATVSPTIPSMKWPEVKALLDASKIILVDARLQVNFDMGHIPGAILLPATSTAEELQVFATKYPKTTAFVTYCGSDSCHMSHQLAESLIKICGYTNVSNMPGGYAEYTIASATAK